MVTEFKQDYLEYFDINEVCVRACVPAHVRLRVCVRARACGPRARACVYCISLASPMFQFAGNKMLSRVAKIKETKGNFTKVKIKLTLLFEMVPHDVYCSGRREWEETITTRSFNKSIICTKLKYLPERSTPLID